MTEIRIADLNYEPYRYLDPERRSGDAYPSLEALALDIHARRRGRALRVVDRWAPWEFGDELRAGVAVEIVEKSGDLADSLLVLTAGERAQDLLDQLAATRAEARKAAA